MDKNKERQKSNVTNEIGKNIQYYREMKGFTQEQLAECINRSTAFISSLECGYRNPSIETLICLADSLNVSTDALINKNLFDYSDSRMTLLIEKIKELPEKSQIRILNILEYMISQEHER